jgi:hypothetical protein
MAASTACFSSPVTVAELDIHVNDPIQHFLNCHQKPAERSSRRTDSESAIETAPTTTQLWFLTHWHFNNLCATGTSLENHTLDGLDHIGNRTA